MRPFVTNNIVISPEMLFTSEVIDKNSIDSHMNKLIQVFKDYDHDLMNNELELIIEELYNNSSYFTVMSGITISLYSIIEELRKNPELRELINLKIPDNMQFNEVDTFIEGKIQKLIKILSNPDNIFSNYLISKTGINIKQLAEVCLIIGFKPDLKGNIIEEPIETNYLRGLNSIQQYYIDCLGCRKSLITNFKKVKESGLSFSFMVA
jgi:hypothetical protein